MKNVLIGIAAGAMIGYVLRKMEDDGKFKCLQNDFTQLTDLAKKKFKNVMDKGANEAEYMANRVQHVAEKINKGTTV